MRTECIKTADHRANGTSCFHLARSGCFVQELYAIGLWPIPNTQTQTSIQAISDRLSKFEDNSVSETDGFNSEAWCDPLNIDFEQLLRQAIKKTAERGGLCMNCVKKGKIGIAEGNCRARSLEFCKRIFN